MSSPATGTVAFLFTDIECSTRLAQAHASEWPALQARHHAILRTIIKSHRGYVYQIIDDALCAALYTAPAALTKALDSPLDTDAGRRRVVGTLLDVRG